MTEIFVQKKPEDREIALVEDGKLIEYYEENESSNRNEGNIYIGIVRDVIKGMQSAFVDIGTEKNSFIHLKDVLPKVDEKKGLQVEETDITKVLKPKQKLLVQVKKDSNSNKGARVSTHINLPSKYIVLMPNTDIITVSQKIENKEEQKRLIELVKNNLSKNNGAIIRTSAEGKTEEIIKDIKYIENVWKNITETSIDSESNKPQLLYKSEDILKKIIKDLIDEKIDTIVVNNLEEKQKIEKFIKSNPECKDIKVKILKKEDILDTYEIRKQISKTKNRKVWLKCGGFITIDKTEALTAIDVNSGKFTGKKEFEKTVVKVNKEASIEIAKQLRLRDIGGIIVIDYIDVTEDKHRKEIMETLNEALKQDRAKTQIVEFTKLNLLEMTRKHMFSNAEE